MGCNCQQKKQYQARALSYNAEPSVYNNTVLLGLGLAGLMVLGAFMLLKIPDYEDEDEDERFVTRRDDDNDENEVEEE